MVTLHDEIAAILLEAGREMSTREIADEVNARGIYRKQDGSHVSPYQVHGRTANYAHMFARHGSMVRLTIVSGADAAEAVRGSSSPSPSRRRTRAPESESTPRESGRMVGLPPVGGPDARVLVLGTFPGVESLARRQYYANARNQFWHVLFAAFDAVDPKVHAARVAFCLSNGVALWDVLEACVRDGSEDSAIVRGSEQPNDVAGWLRAHRSVRVVLLNGAKAAALFRRHVGPALSASGTSVEAVTMPSTSAARAMPAHEKRSVWVRALQGVA